MTLIGKLTLGMLFAATSLTMCSNDSTSSEPTNLQSEIEAQWKKFIKNWETEDSEGLVAMYAADGINIPPESAAKKGRSEIQAFYNMLFDGNQSSQYRHEIEQIHFNGNTATEYGNFEVRWVRNDGTEWTFNARSMTYWTKVEGDWKINLFLFNTPPAK